MKTFKLISLFSLIITGVFAQNKQEKTIESFSGISASGAVNMKYRNSDTSKVVLYGESEDFNNIEFYTKENTLFIKSVGTIKNPLSVYVSGNKLSQVDLSGASSLKTNELLQVPYFNIITSGASNLNLSLNCNFIKVLATGASNVNLNGTAHNIDATINSAANLKAYELMVDTCSINAAGASNAKVNVAQKITINATGASNVKFKGNPKEVAAEGGSSSKIMKIGSDEMSSSVNPQDSSKNKTTFKFKNKQFIIIDNNDPKKDSLLNKNKNGDLTRKHWQGLWIGFAGYTNPQHGFTMTSPNKYMELDYARSFSFQWNIIQKNLNIYKKYIQLSTGLGFQFSNLSFENKTKLNADSSFTTGVIDASGKYSYSKDRFKQAYVVVPLLLNINTNKNLKNNLHFSFGVVGKYLLTSKTKQVLTDNSDKYTITRNDSYNLNPFQLDAYASVGYRNLTVFAQSGLTDMFQSGKGVQVYGFSAGIRLLSFNHH
jgi:hypothetical protein